MDQEIEAVIAVADVLRLDGSMFAAEALRPLHDGKRLFWEEANKRLLYRGPASRLTQMSALNSEAAARTAPCEPPNVALSGAPQDARETN